MFVLVVAESTTAIFADVFAVPTDNVEVATYAGATPTPPEANTEPVATSGSFVNVVAELATSRSPTANGTRLPVPP